MTPPAVVRDVSDESGGVRSSASWSRSPDEPRTAPAGSSRWVVVCRLPRSPVHPHPRRHSSRSRHMRQAATRGRWARGLGWIAWGRPPFRFGRGEVRAARSPYRRTLRSTTSNVKGRISPRWPGSRIGACPRPPRTGESGPVAAVSIHRARVHVRRSMRVNVAIYRVPTSVSRTPARSPRGEALEISRNAHAKRLRGEIRRNYRVESSG